MKATKIISECELFRLFSLCGEAFSSDEISARLEAAIEHFVERISRLLRKRPVIDQLRLLAHLCGYLERMKYRYAEEPIKKGYFETIIAHVEIERRILLVQLRYPALATQQSKHIRSPYYWSAEYTLTDLMELISALHASGAIRKADGTPAELNKLVRTFELLLNVSMQHIYITDYQRLFILIGTTSVLTNTKNVWTNANHCISWFCIYVLYRLFSALLWNVRYQIQCIG